MVAAVALPFTRSRRSLWSALTTDTVTMRTAINFRGTFGGCPVILDMHVVGEHGRWRRVRLDTNAGYRELFCTEVTVLEHDRIGYDAQRTRPSRSGCNPRVPWAGSLGALGI
jgi:hypothetical protein